MTKVQPTTAVDKSAAKSPQKRMYRGILRAQAVADVFVRSTSEAAAKTAIEAGKGQRMKPRFGAWELCQDVIAVERYAASNIPVRDPSSAALTAQEFEKIYAQVLQNISVVRRGAYSDRKRQAMVDAVREFYELLTETMQAKVRGSKE